jgi:peptidoglycan/xylan/chitin deacetylase (PgdA/CDA1 family)
MSRSKRRVVRKKSRHEWRGPSGAKALRKLREYRIELMLLLSAALLLLAGIAIQMWNQDLGSAYAEIPDDARPPLVSKPLQLELAQTRQSLDQLNDAEARNGMRVEPDSAAQARLDSITAELKQQKFKKAKSDLDALNKDIVSWQKQLDTAVSARKTGVSSSAAAPPSNALNVPILIYHKPPGDFENQLEALISKGYTAIDLGQLVGAMNKTVQIPKKSVVITLDDGFEDQMSAVNLLEKYHLKATFFIIDGGDISNWCIGAGRQYNLPSQPKNGCGDAYLTWDQVRAIDQTGLITIGAHTVNHRALASLSADQQLFEIEQGKKQLESELGHSVQDFAYPNGSFNQTTINLVRDAGFRSAVTTLPGTYQVIGGVFTLHRVRSTYDLP